MTRRDLFAGALGAILSAIALVALLALRGPFAVPAPRPPSSPMAEATTNAATFARDEQAFRSANENLAKTVAETQQRLDRNEAEKRSLEADLKLAQAKLSASRTDGAPARDEFDLTADDWKGLAAAGKVKARYPCNFNGNWRLGNEATTALGLSRDEVSRVEAAYTTELDRLAGVIQAACARALGNPELARRLGTEVCVAVNTHSVQDDRADLQTVADIRAGNVPVPADGALDPFATMLLAQTGSSRRMEEALAPSFGPEDAHRIAFSNAFGECSGTWGSP